MTTSEPMSSSAIGCTRFGQRLFRAHGVQRVALDAQDVGDFHGAAPRCAGAETVNIAHNRHNEHHSPGNTPMAGSSDPGFDTLALHAGAAPDPATGARAVPIHLTHELRLREQRARGEPVQHGALGPCLQPHQQPDQRGARRARGRARRRRRRHRHRQRPGGAAPGHRHARRRRLAHRGSSALYGGTHNLLHYTLARFGIETTFVKPGDIDGWRAAIRPNTKLLFGETLGNPGLDVLDIPTVSAIAHDAGLPLLVDSTFTTPWLMKPFDHGADLVFHSATKFLSGHGTVIGGVLVDSGHFDWDDARAASPN